MLTRWRSGLGEWDATASHRACPVDVSVTDREVLVRADVPGFRWQEIEVACDSWMLTIVAHRAARRPPGRRHLAERRNWHLQRNLPLPCRVGGDRMVTGLEHGVLEIRLPKYEEEPMPVEPMIRTNGSREPASGRREAVTGSEDPPREDPVPEKPPHKDPPKPRVPRVPPDRPGKRPPVEEPPPATKPPVKDPPGPHESPGPVRSSRRP